MIQLARRWGADLVAENAVVGCEEAVLVWRQVDAVALRDDRERQLVLQRRQLLQELCRSAAAERGKK